MAASVGLGACRASISADAHAGVDRETEGESDEPTDEDSTNAQAAFAQDASGQPALLGARHDLMLAGDHPQPSCSCLAVVLGDPSNPAFFWTSVVPSTNAETQLVIALTSERVACNSTAPDSLGASYWGYRVADQDVIVVVENAAFGRPVTSGAIIPAPGPGGAVYVEPLDSKVPYGRPLDASGKRCRIERSGAHSRLVPAPPSAGP